MAWVRTVVTVERVAGVVVSPVEEEWEVVVVVVWEEEWECRSAGHPVEDWEVGPLSGRGLKMVDIVMDTVSLLAIGHSALVVAWVVAVVVAV